MQCALSFLIALLRNACREGCFTTLHTQIIICIDVSMKQRLYCICFLHFIGVSFLQYHLLPSNLKFHGRKSQLSLMLLQTLIATIHSTSDVYGYQGILWILYFKICSKTICNFYHSRAVVMQQSSHNCTKTDSCIMPKWT